MLNISDDSQASDIPDHGGGNKGGRELVIPMSAQHKPYSPAIPPASRCVPRGTFALPASLPFLLLLLLVVMAGGGRGEVAEREVEPDMVGGGRDWSACKTARRGCCCWWVNESWWVGLSVDDDGWLSR